MKFSDINKRAAAVAVMASALTMAGLTTGSASAATGTGDVEIMGNAPDCVAVWVTQGRITQTGHARNDCGYRMNLKIIWAHGVDGPCTSVNDGWTLTSQVAKAPRVFDGASTC
jgi:hypothetical protein